MLTDDALTTLRTRRLEAVVIGTSAGGVDALGKILPALPAGTPFPVVVCIHLLRERPSALVELFGPRCALPVREAGDKDELGRGTVWFAPPDYHLLVERDRTFSLSIERPVNHSRPSIDPLFESAAAAYGKSLVAVVLTGASEDGAMGAAAVRAAGGYVVVEDPATADMAIMPRAAIARANPDFIAPLAEIAALLRSSALERRP